MKNYEFSTKIVNIFTHYWAYGDSKSKSFWSPSHLIGHHGIFKLGRNFAILFPSNKEMAMWVSSWFKDTVMLNTAARTSKGFWSCYSHMHTNDWKYPQLSWKIHNFSPNLFKIAILYFLMPSDSVFFLNTVLIFEFIVYFNFNYIINSYLLLLEIVNFSLLLEAVDFRIRRQTRSWDFLEKQYPNIPISILENIQTFWLQSQSRGCWERQINCITHKFLIAVLYLSWNHNMRLLMMNCRARWKKWSWSNSNVSSLLKLQNSF